MIDPDSVMQVTITPRQLATIRALFGQLTSIDDESSDVFDWSCNLLPEMGSPMGLDVTSHITSNPMFKNRVEDLLRANGYSSIPDVKLKEVL